MPPSERTSIRESNALIWIVVIAAFLGIGGFGLSLRSIHSSVETTVRSAQSRHAGDAVEALISLIESDSATFREKNRAIWALGQIGDKRALPVLEQLDTGEVQVKPYDPDRYIVLYSVRKAIKQIRGDLSLTRWIYSDLRQERKSH